MSDKLLAATHGARVEARLRLHAPHSDYESLMVEAANEIERLRGRVITERKELWDLPTRSVILTRWNDGAVIHPLHVGDLAFAENVLPATVLWTPDV